MYQLETVYPFALAGANVFMGWVLYHVSEPIFGGLLVVIGLFVVLASIGRTVSEHRPALGEFT
jgi:hypothetical protein